MNDALRTHVAAALARGLLRMQQQATGRTPVPVAMAMQAALRRGVPGGFGHDARADAALLRMLRLPEEDGKLPAFDAGMRRAMEDAGLIATLVASTRVTVYEPTAEGAVSPWYTRSLGNDLRAVKGRRTSGAYENLLHALLRADRADLARPLRRALTLMRSDGGRLDVYALFFDIGRWSADSGEVQKRWAYHFWSSAETRSADIPTDDKEPA